MKVFGIHESVSLRSVCFDALPLFGPLLTGGKHKCVNYAGRNQ